jgi:D-3-phosphoglycerate dehydrogenase
MKNQIIFIALSTFAADDKKPLQLLEASGFPYKIHQSGKRITPEELLRDGIDASVIVAGVESYDINTLSNLKGLQCISRCGVGVDAIDLDFARKNNICVANTPMVPVQAVAELALTMFLALSRNVRQQSNLMKEKRWERITGHLLSGRTIGLIGFGRIGQKVASLSNAFGAHVIAFDPYADKKLEGELDIRLIGFDDLLSQSDIVSIHASKVSDHPVIIGESQMDRMKDGAMIVNLSRGEMLDETALIKALNSGKISGAGLDVFSEEPYKGPLCDFDQVILSPHCATLTYETRSEMEIQCVENAIAFLNGNLNAERRVV